jgi:hypothetical protein
VTDAPLPPNACSIDPDDGQVAIAAAIGACPDGSTILFPPNETYHQTDKINVERRSDLVIDGNGSTFVKTSPSTGSDALGSSSTRPNWQLLENKNVTLQDMTIRGAFSDPPFPRNPNLVPGPNQYDHGIAIFGGEEITLRDLSVFNVLGEFVSIAPSGFIRGGGALAGEVPRNIHVERLHGEHAGRQCIAPTAVVGFWLTDSYLADCQQAGVDMEMDVAGEPIQDVHILRNRISDYYFSAITVPLSGKTGDVEGVEIRGNVTLTPPDTCFPTVLITYRSDGSTAADIVTEDNDLQTLSSGITYRDVASGSIRNNRIRKTAPNSLCGPSSAQTVQLVNSPNVVVSSNTAIEDGIRLVH